MEDIAIILLKVNRQIENLEASYNKALNNKKILNELSVDIKNILENLRSALDYLAIFLHKFATCSKRHKIYFPWAETDIKFDKSFKENLHNMGDAFINIKSIIENIQPYKTIWSGDFLKLVNEYKHIRLIPQKEIIKRIVVIDKKNGGKVSWDPNKVSFGKGISIFGKSVNSSTQLPNLSPNIDTEIWKDFYFENINKSVLGSLKLFSQEITNFFKIVEIAVKNKI